jgi:hypothetical protein
VSEQVINELCQKFHTTVDNLIPVYSKYAMSKDIGSCIICIILIIISILYLIYLKHYFNKENIYDWIDLPMHHLFGSAFVIFIILGCVIALCLNIYDYVLWSNCPQMRFLDYFTSQIS